MLILRCFVVFIIGLVVSGCSNKAATFLPAPSDTEKGSLVYVYRPSNSANFMMSPRFVLDENEKFQIDSGKYRYLYVQSGKHSFALSSANQYETQAPEGLLVKPEKRYYLRVKTSLTFNPEGMNKRLFWVEQVEEKVALTEIGDTDYSGPRQSVNESVNSKESTTGGFSIDKTQDPFAGKY